MINNRFRSLAAGLAALAGMGLADAVAATISWTGTAGDGSWATGGNWSNGTGPANSLTTDVAAFNSAGFSGTLISSLGGADRLIAGLIFNSDASGNITIAAGNTLTVGGTGISVGAGTGSHTINAAMVLGATQTWNNVSSNLFILGGTLTTGANTLNLTGTNGFTVNGLVAVTGTSTFNNTGTGALSLAGGATLTSNLTLSGTGSIAVGGTLTNSGADRTLTVNNGNVTLNNIALTEGTTARTFTLAAASGVTVTVNGVIANGGSANSAFRADGLGTVVLNGANTFTHELRVFQGTVRVNATNTAGNQTNSIVLAGATFASGYTSTLDINGAGVAYNLGGNIVYAASGGISGTSTIMGTGTLNLNGNRTIEVRPSSATTAELVISATIADGSGSGRTISKTRNGTLVFSGDNTYTGSTTVGEGILRLDYSGNTGTKLSATAGLILTGARLELVGHATTAVTETVTATTINRGANYVYADSSAGGSVTMELGTIAAPAAGGTVDFGLPSVGAIRATFTNTNGIFGGHSTVNGSSFAANDGSGNVVAVTGVEQDNVALWPAGGNITDGSGAGYSGSLVQYTAINSLTFSSSAGSVVGITTGALNVRSGGILFANTIGSGSSSISGGVITSSVDSLYVHQHNTAQTATIASAVTGNIHFVKSGAGTLILDSSGSNYTGTTYINQGTLIVQGGNAIGDNSTVDLDPVTGALLQLNSNETIGTLQGGGADGGNVAIGSNTLTINQATQQTFAGIFTGNGTIVKSGSSNLLLSSSGNSGFTGTVIVNQGRFWLDTTSVMTGVTAFTVNGAELLSQQDQSSGTDHIGNSASITLNNTAGFAGLWVQNENQDATRTEDVGAVILGAGHNTIQADINGGTNASRMAELLADQLTRNNKSTALVRGAALGASAGARGRIRFNLAQPGGGVGGGGGNNTTTITILPYLVGDTSITGLGNSFVTNRDTAVGLRPLDLTTEYILNEAGYNGLSGVTQHNVRFAENPALALTGGSKTINSLVLDSGTAALSVMGNGADTLTIASGAILATTVTAGNATTLGGFAAIQAGGTNDYIVYVTNGAHTFTINSALTSTNALVKSGAGTLVLGAASNSVTDVYFNQGLIEVANLSQLGTGTLNFFGGGLRWAASSTFDVSTRTVNLSTGGGTLDTNGNNVTLTNAIGAGGTGGLTKAGAGVLTLQAAAGYSGATTVAGGTLRMAINQAISTGDLVVNNAVLDMQGFNATVGRVTLANAAGSSITGTGVLTSNDSLFDVQRGTIAVSLAGTSSLIKSTNQTVVLSGNNTYTGYTEIRDGVLSFNSIADVGGGASALGAPVTIEAGAIKMGSGTTGGTLNYTGTGHSSNRRIDLIGAAATSAIDADGTGALVLGGINAVAPGNKVVTLQGASAAGIVNRIDGDIQQLGTGAIGINKSDANTWQLNGNNSYTGTTNVNNGKLRLGHANALGSTTGGTTIAGGGVSAGIVLFGDRTYAAETITMGAKTAASNGASIINESGNNNWTGNINFTTGGGFYGIESQSGKLTVSGTIRNETNTSARTLTLLGAGDGEVTGTLADGDAGPATEQLSLAFTGSGTWTLSGTNTFSGTTTINAATSSGTLRLTGATNLGSAVTPVMTINAGVLDLAGTWDPAFGLLTMGGGVANTTATLAIGAGRVVTSSGTVYSSTNNAQGAFINGAGTFALGGGTYEFNIADSTGAAIEMDVQSAISGSGILRKTGAGVLRIGNSSGFTGTYSIEGGTLAGDIGTAHLVLNDSVYATSGTFNRALGTSGNTVEWATDKSGGFAAIGGALLVDLDFSGPLVWGSTPQFLTNAGQLWLSSTGADNVVTWSDAIDFNNTSTLQTRTINVFDNNLSTVDKAVFSSVISRSGTGDTLIDKTGAGALELTADNSAFNGGTTGGFRVSAGSLQFTTELNLGAAANRLVVNGSTAALEFIGSAAMSGTRNVLMTAAGSAVTASGTSGAVMALNQISSSSTDYALNGSSNGTVNDLFAGGTLAITKSGTGTWRVLAATTSAAATDYDLTVSGGTLELAAANAFVGDDFTVNNGGTLLLSVSNAFSSIDDGTVATGGLLNLGTALTHAMDALTISGGTIRGSGSTLGITGVTGTGTTGVVEAGVTLSMGASSRTFSVTNATDVLTILGDVTGTGGLAKGGNGTLSVRSALGYSGTTTISTGNLLISGSGSVQNSATFTVGDNNGADELLTIGQTSDTSTGSRVGDTAAINFNGSTRLFVNGGTDLNYTETMGALGVTVGRGSLVLNSAGSGSVTLAATSLTLNARGILAVRGNNLGSSGSGGSRLTFTTAPTQLGSAAAAGNTAMSIVDRVVVDDPANGGFGFAAYDATNGLRALTSSEYATSATGLTLAARNNVTTAGGATVAGAQFINALRVTGGTTTVDTDANLRIYSGAILATANATISGGGTINFADQAGVLTAAGNTTAASTAATTLNVNANLSGTNGLIISSVGINTNDPSATSGATGYAQNVVSLGGDNRLLIGTVTINSGKLNLASSTALSSNAVTVVVNTTGSLDFMSQSATIRNFSTGNGTSLLSTGSGNATLTLLNTAASTVAASINVSGGGTLGLVKTGSATLTFNTGNTTLNAPVVVREGILELVNSARFLGGASSIYRVTASTLRVNNVNSTNNNQTDRLVSTAEMVLRSGAFQFDNDRASTLTFAESVGTLTSDLGMNTYTTDTSASGTGSTIMTFASLNRTAGSGSTMVFTNFVSADDIAIGENNASRARLVFTTAPTLTNGIIGGWAYHIKNINTATTFDPVNFATYLTDSSTGTAGDQPSLAAFSAYDTGAETGWTNTTVASPAASATLTNNREVYALKLTDGINLNLAGFTLNVISGGIIQNPSVATAATISGGVLTAGGTSAGELVFMVESNLVANTLTVSSAINDNTGGAVTVVKAGTDTLALAGTNGYSGGTIINQGRVVITADNNLGATPVAADSDNIQLNGGELFVNASMTLNANRGIRAGGAGGSLIVASTAALTYNGTLASIDDAQIVIDGDRSVSGTTAVIGDATINVSQALNLAGGLVYSADGTMTLTGTTNTIARSLSVGMDQSLSLLVYNGGAGSTLNVGTNRSFANELNIGYRTATSDTTTTVTRGFLNLSGTENFNVNVDILRMGVLVGAGEGAVEGDLTIGVNSNLVVNQQILMGDSQSGGNGGVTSNLVFGSGVNNVTTPLMIVGSDKSTASVTIAAGGTLNMGGFGANTMDLSIAQNDISTGVVSAGTFDMSGGVLNGSFDQISVATKSGGNNSGATGTFTLGTVGNNVVANSLLVGSMTAGANNVAAFASGTVTIGSGTFNVRNDVTLAAHDNTANGGAKGTLRITGGTVTIGGNIAKSTVQTNRSAAIVTVEGGILDLRDEDAGDTTMGSIVASQLNYRGGVIRDVTSVTLDGFDVTSGTALANLVSALIMRDVTAAFNISLINTTANQGGILYEAAGGGGGGTISGNVDLGTVNRTIQVEDNGSAEADLTITGVVSNTSGTAGVTKTGSGTLVMGGNNTYSGATVVSAGTLLVNGDMSAATGNVTVGSTAALGGTGKVGGNTTVQSGGFLNVGDPTAANSRGRLSFAGNVTLSSASVTMFELGTATFTSNNMFGNNEVGSAGYYTYITTNGVGQGDHDQIALTGTLGTITQQDGAKIVVLPGTYGSAQYGQIFNLIDWVALNGFTASSQLGANYRDGAGDAGFDLDLPDISGTGFVWDISRFGSDGILVVVPEPGRAMLLMMGLGLLFVRRRRK